MASYQTHRIVGGLVGGAAAFVCAQNQPPLLAAAETVGGLLFGQYAGPWADVVEPATSSYHRVFAHALVPTALGATFVFKRVDSLQASLRSQAQIFFQQAANTNDGLESFLNYAAGFLLHMLAGAVPAVPASYLSHIALDAASPRSVPLLLSGF